MNRLSGCFSNIRLWLILISIVLGFRIFKELAEFLVLSFLYFLALILLLFYFKGLLDPIANSACRFLFKENIIDTREHLGQQELKIYNYTGFLRAYLELGNSPTSEFINLECHSDAVTTLAISSDNRWVISGSKDMTLRIYDLKEILEEYLKENLKEIKARFIITGHQDRIDSVALTPDSRLLMSSSSDGIAKGWDFTSLTEGQSIGSSISKFQLKSKSRIADDNAYLYLGLIITFLEIVVSISIFVYIDINALRDALLDGHSFNALLDGHPLPLFVLLLWLSAFVVIGVLYAGVASLINDNSDSINNNSDDVGQIVVTPNNETVIFGSSDQMLKDRGLALPTRFITLGEHGDRIACMAVIDSSRVIYGFCNGTLKGYNLDLHREIFSFNCSFSVTAVAVIPGRNLAVLGLHDGSLMVYDLEERQVKSPVEGHRGIVKAIAIIPDTNTNYFVSVSDSNDRIVKTWCVSDDGTIAPIVDSKNKPVEYKTDYPSTCCAVASTVRSNKVERFIIVGDERGGIEFLQLPNLP